MCLSTHTFLASSPISAGRHVVGSSCSRYQLHYTLHWALCFPAGAMKHGCEQTVTAFCRKKERWWKEQGRQGRQGALLGSQSADVQDPGLWHEGVRGDLYHWGPYYWLLGTDITGKHGVYSSIPVREACVISKRNTMNEWESLSHLQKPRAM